jgi:hypothetical protein
MVFTDSVVAFAHIGKEKMLDVIPMKEIVNIHDCDGVDVVETDERAGRVLLEIEWKVRAHHSTYLLYKNLLSRA